MSDLTDFLLGCIAEDEWDAREEADRLAEEAERTADSQDVAEVDPRATTPGLALAWWTSGQAGDPARVLAECQAKRRIVEYHIECTKGDGPIPPNSRLEGVIDASAWAVRHLAAAHADHPDYREEWRP